VVEDFKAELRTKPNRTTSHDKWGVQKQRALEFFPKSARCFFRGWPFWGPPAFFLCRGSLKLAADNCPRCTLATRAASPRQEVAWVVVRSYGATTPWSDIAGILTEPDVGIHELPLPLPWLCNPFTWSLYGPADKYHDPLWSVCRWPDETLARILVGEAVRRVWREAPRGCCGNGATCRPYSFLSGSARATSASATERLYGSGAPEKAMRAVVSTTWARASQPCRDRGFAWENRSLLFLGQSDAVRLDTQDGYGVCGERSESALGFSPAEMGRPNWQPGIQLPLTPQKWRNQFPGGGLKKRAPTRGEKQFAEHSTSTRADVARPLCYALRQCLHLRPGLSAAIWVDRDWATPRVTYTLSRPNRTAWAAAGVELLPGSA